MPREPVRLATALGDAFLADEWTTDGLRTQVELVLRPGSPGFADWCRRCWRAIPTPSDRPRSCLCSGSRPGRRSRWSAPRAAGNGP